MQKSDAYDVTSRILYYVNDDGTLGISLARAYVRWFEQGLVMTDLLSTDFDDTALVLLRQLLKLPRQGDARHEAVLEIGAEILARVAAGGEIKIVDAFRLCQVEASGDDAD